MCFTLVHVNILFHMIMIEIAIFFYELYRFNTFNPQHSQITVILMAIISIYFHGYFFTMIVKIGTIKMLKKKAAR